MKNIIHYEKRKSDDFVLSCIPFACCMIASGIEMLSGEKPSFWLLGITFCVFAFGLSSHIQRKHKKGDKDERHL